MKKTKNQKTMLWIGAGVTSIIGMCLAVWIIASFKGVEDILEMSRKDWASAVFGGLFAGSAYYLLMYSAELVGKSLSKAKTITVSLILSFSLVFSVVLAFNLMSLVAGLGLSLVSAIAMVAASIWIYNPFSDRDEDYF